MKKIKIDAITILIIFIFILIADLYYQNTKINEVRKSQNRIELKLNKILDINGRAIEAVVE